MDYSDLKIGNRQIRVLTLCLVPSDADPASVPVQCTLAVREQPLPADLDSWDSTHFPPNHINFDQCVTRPPQETFVNELREALAPNLGLVEQRRADGTEDLVLTLAAHNFPDMLTPKDRLRTMSMPGRGGKRRVWDAWGVMHAYEDAAGHAVFIGDFPVRPHVGGLDPDHINPFFRSNTRDKTSYFKEVAQHDNYVAMSYAWGPPEPTAEIWINGTAVTVRENLAAALRQFRTMDYFRFGGKIWIDSLCINQADEAEKQVQVQMMASIYRHAGNIIVWLGPKGADSDLAISYLERIGADYRAEYLEALDWSDTMTALTWRTVARVRMETRYEELRDANNGANGTITPLALDLIAPALYNFFDRPYWRRLWIIQELCMGRGGMPVVCGSRVTQWRHIRDGALRCTAILDILREVAGNPGEHATWRRQQPLARDHSLLHVAQIAELEITGHRRRLPPLPADVVPILAPTHHEHGPGLDSGSALRRAIALAAQSECSVPHDRIYGMLSIPGLPHLDVQVDYSKPVVDVFTEFTVACVKHESLDFFSLLDGGYMSKTDEHGKAQPTEKPSWVPDYGAKPSRRLGVLDGHWNAGGYVPIRWGSPEVLGTTLVCMGKVVDSVDGIGAMSKADVEAGSIIDGDAAFFGTTQPKQKSGTGGGLDPEKVLYDVLVGGSDMKGAETPASFACLYSAFPAEEPTRGSTFYRNWHFLRSSADLQIGRRPLSTYFKHLKETPTPEEPEAGAEDDPEAPQTEPFESLHDELTAMVRQILDSRLSDIDTAGARQAMEARTKMRRLIVTASGLLGLAPVQTQPEDAVIVIVGHGKPVIARKVKEKDGQCFWYLIGEAYIPGMMQAEKLPLSTKPWHRHETEETLEGVGLIPFV